MAASEELRPGERLDDLLIGGWRIIQHAGQFRFSLDAVLLAHFATVKKGAAAFDLGAGTGVLGLLLAARGAASVTGLEINPAMAEMAARTIALNGLSNRLNVLAGDVREVRRLFPAGRADLVVSNPPYRPVGSGRHSPLAPLALARHEVAGGLADFVSAAAYLLRTGGRLALIHLTERLTDVLTELRGAAIEPKRLRLIQPAAGKDAKLFLVEGVAGARPGLALAAPLVIVDEAGGYSREILSYYQAGE